VEILPQKSRLIESGIATLSTNAYLIKQITQITKATGIQTFAHYVGIRVVQNGI
jgi:hypothetical protein